MSITQSIRRAIWRLVPSAEVPLKYWEGRMRGWVEPEQRIARRLTESSRTAVDVGSNTGGYSYVFHRAGAKVVAIEPQPELAAALRAFANKHQGSVRVLEVALSDVAGKAMLRLPGHHALATLRLEPDAPRAIEVDIARLDDLALANISIVKIDVEGHEHAVLKGAEETLRRDRPALLIEIEQRHRAEPIASTFQYLSDLGYAGFFLLGGTVKPLAEFDLRRHQEWGQSLYVANFFFIHRSDPRLRLLQRGG